MAKLRSEIATPDFNTFTMPLMAAAGAFGGYLVGTANGASWAGVAGGIIVAALLAIILIKVVPNRATGRLGTAIVLGLGGFILAGLSGLIVGVVLA